MKQKVHSVSYLAKAEFEFKSGVYDLVALPTGAEVVKVSLEVVGGQIMDGHVHVGLKDNHSYFLVLDARSSSGDRVIDLTRDITSVKDYTATSNNIVVAEVANTNNVSSARCILRVLYFLPSVIEVEY